MGLTRRISLAVALVGVALLIAVGVLAYAIRELDRSGEEARRAQATLTASEQVKSLIVDAETGLRGFALTDRDVFLEPLLSAESNLPEATAALTNAELPNERARVLADSIRTNALAYVADYANPLLTRLRTDPEEGRGVIAVGTGKRRVDQIRADLSELGGIVRRQADDAVDNAAGHATSAQWLAGGAGLLAVVLFAMLIIYLDRAVVAPIRRHATAASAIGAGDLSVRVDEHATGELGALAQAFNTMGASLAHNAEELDAQQVELESQNAELEQQAVELESQAVELEAQTAELEAGQIELTDANEALEARRRELEARSEDLREAHERTKLFAKVADELGRLSALQDRADLLVTRAADMIGAEVGAVYAADSEETAPRIVSVRGIDAGVLPSTVDGLQGLAGRAFREGQSLHGAHPDGDLRLASFGAEVRLRRELHVPLRLGERVLGVLSLGRSDGAPLDADDVGAVERLCEQAAVSFENAIESERRRWLADVQSAVLNSTGDAIRMVGRDGRVLMDNPEMLRFEREVFELSRGGDDVDLDAMVDRLAQRTADPVAYRARVQQVITEPEQEYVDEYELVDTHRWVRRLAAPVYTDGGQFAGQIFVLRETTKERRAEALKDELMSTVSHELRTPLSAILGFAELLKARDYAKPERDEYLDTIHTQAKRLADLITDFLDVQRLEQRGDEIARQPVELGSLLSQQVDLFEAQSSAHPVRLEAKGVLVVHGDEDRLRRAVANLISNAIKYSPEGGEVLVQAERHNGDVLLAVRDRGIGISPEQQRHVFDRFYRVDSASTRKIGGTGLGLALVREIALAHGGDVGVESVEGQGSRFWLRLPAGAATDA